MVNPKFDIETGSGGQLYPVMAEEQDGPRWGSIRLVYSVCSLYFLISLGIGLAVFHNNPVREFMQTRWVVPGLLILSFMLSLLMYAVGKRRPWNYVLLILIFIFSVFLAGAFSARETGKIILLALGFALLSTVILTLYTFFAEKRGYDSKFPRQFLVVMAVLLLAFGIAWIIFPAGSLEDLVVGCVVALLACGFIISDVDDAIDWYM